MTTVLYVSPHLDDVALSCACRLIADLREGARVVVVTLFTEGADRLYPERRSEDRRALEGAGAEAVHLGLLDAPDRLGRSLSFTSLLLGEPPTDDDIARTRRALAPVIDTVAPDRTWWPLAVGGHVDHRVCHACHTLVGDAARFYLDRPYDLIPALRQLRLHELEGGPPPTVGADAIEHELKVARVLDLMFAGGERDRCTRELAHRLSAALPRTGRAVEVEATRWPPTIVSAAATLITGYPTQLRWILPPGESVTTTYEHLAGDPGGWVESIAKIVPLADNSADST